MPNEKNNNPFLNGKNMSVSECHTFILQKNVVQWICLENGDVIDIDKKAPTRYFAIRSSEMLSATSSASVFTFWCFTSSQPSFIKVWRYLTVDSGLLNSYRVLKLIDELKKGHEEYIFSYPQSFKSPRHEKNFREGSMFPKIIHLTRFRDEALES